MLLKGCGKRLVVRVLGVSSFGMLAGGLVFPGTCQAQVSALVTTHRAFPYGVVNLSAESGFGNGKYVDGYVKMTGTGKMLYPVGHKGVYRPFVANADGSIVGAYFKESAEAPSQFSAAFSFSSKAGNVKSVSAQEFWNIDGTTPTAITLIWDEESKIEALTSGDLSVLRIMGWDAQKEKWVVVPAKIDETSFSGVVSNASAGSITTTEQIVPDAYSIYTLGTAGEETEEIKPVAADSALTKSRVTVAAVKKGDELYSLSIVEKNNAKAFNIGGESFESPEVTIYPNPVSSKLFLRIPAAEKLDKLEILDLSGRTVLSAKSEATSERGLNIENLRGGIYIVKLLTVSGLEFNRKVVVKGN